MTFPLRVRPPGDASPQFGLGLTALPDLNGDGTTDILVGAPQDGPREPLPEGRAYAFSGRDGRLIDSVAYPEARYPDSLSYEQSFGRGMARLGDLDGDGVDDLVVAPLNLPPHLFSGATLDPLRLLPRGRTYGWAFASLDDVTGDGVDEVIAGMARGVDTTLVLDGATDRPVRELTPPPAHRNGSFGAAVARVGDLNGDGTADLAVGAPGDTLNQRPEAGRVYLYSGRDGSRLRAVAAPTPQAGGRFGQSVAVPGDVNGDGTPDLAIGAPGRRADGRDRMGQAYVVSGASGEVLHTLPAPPPEGRRGWGFGAFLTAPGDLTDDGISELLVGANGLVRAKGLQGFLFDGASGRALPVKETDPSYGVPRAAAPVGDLTGDGTPDLLFSGNRTVWVVSGARVQSRTAVADERPATVHRYPVQQDGAWGYIDAAGQVVVEPRFEAAEPFADGLAKVTLDGQPAFIDSTGAVVLRPDVSTDRRGAPGRAVRSFSGGRAAASPSDTPLWGFVDTTGTYVIEPQFATAYSFANGRAAVEKNGAFGYINRDGEMVIEPRFENARRFGNGRAPVLVTRAGRERWGYTNRSGEMVIEPRYAGALPFSEGRAAVNTSDDEFEGEYHFINPSGETVIEASSFSFSRARPFSGGLAPVKGGFDDAWGYVNREGEVVIDHEYAFAEPFHGPLARVATSYTGGIGVRRGGPLPEYTVKGAAWIYVNKDGEQVWP